MSGAFTKRMAGKMAKLKGSSIPKRFLFFDTETTVPLKDNDIRSFKLILGRAIFVELDKDLNIKRREVYEFNEPHGFIEIIKSYIRKKTTLYIFAHNIGFDVRVLDLPYLLDLEGFKSQPPIINEMVFIWRVNSDNGNFLFLDTANLGVRSVAALGKDMGFGKLDIDFSNSSLTELSEYCLRDVEVLEKFVLTYIRYLQANELGSFKVTLASQALTGFRTKFMHNPPTIHNVEPVLSLERRSYHGGRVECFRLGEMPKQDYYYLDVNSMYPYAMKGNDLPIEYLGHREHSNIGSLRVRLEKYYLIADVVITTDEPVYPILKDNKLIFPTGTFRATLSHPELLYAYEHGHIQELGMCSQYTRGSVFDDYIDFFYNEKVKYTLAGDKTHRTVVKLWLNTLYGKLAQQQPHREDLGEVKFKGVYREPCLDRDTHLHFQYVSWFGQLYKEYKHGETSFSVPSLASAVTAKARMLLWMYIKQAGINEVLYCDTDSLITTRRGYDNLTRYCDETKLGSLKLEAQSDYLVLSGNKDYKFGNEVKHKGLPSKAVQISKNEWEYLEFQGFIRWMNEGAKGEPKGEFKRKQRKASYNKGNIQPNGYITPFVLSL